MSGVTDRDRNLIKARSCVIAFRGRWLSEMETRAARTLEHKTGRGELRRVFLLQKDKGLLDSFEKERYRVETRITALYPDGSRRCRALWLPSVVRNCTKLDLVTSPAVSQKMLAGRDLLRVPKLELDAMNGAEGKFVQRRRSGSRYALAVSVREGNDTLRFEVPMTEWAVVEVRGQITREGTDLRQRPRKSRDHDGSGRWEIRHNARRVLDRGALEVYAWREERLEFDFE